MKLRGLRAAPLLLGFVFLGCANSVVNRKPPRVVREPLPQALQVPTVAAEGAGKVVAASEVAPNAAQPTPSLRPVTLAEVLERAESDAAEVLEAERNLAAATARVGVVDGALLPGLRAGGRARYLDGRQVGSLGAEANVDFSRFETGVSLFYRVNPGRAVQRSFSARRAEAAALGEAGDATRRAMLSAGLAYQDLVRAYATIEIADKLALDAGRFLAIARARAVAEVASRADVARAEAELAAARQSRINARAEWEVASAMLATLLRWDPAQNLEPVGSAGNPRALVDVSSPGSLTREALAARPDLRAAQARAVAADHTRQAAWWSLVGPGIELEGTQRWIGTEIDDLGHTTIGSMLLGWTFRFEDWSRIQEAKAEAEASSIAARAVADRARGEVQAAWSQVQAAAEVIPEAHNGLAAAERSHRIQIARFEAGTGLGLEVIEALNAVARARLRLVTAVLRYNAEQLRLLAAIGHLDPSVISEVRPSVETSEAAD